MALAKRSIQIKEFKPGYVSNGDFSDVLNPGFKTFKNWRVESATGRLKKEKGFYRVALYDETGKDNGNIAIDFDRLNTGAGGYPNINIFNCRPFVTTQGGAEVTYRDVLTHKIVNNVNEIWRIRYNASGQVVEQKKISVDGQFQGAANVRFIDTPDFVYIVNDYVKDTVSGTVYKYKYARELAALDADVIQNISMSSEIAVFARIISGGSAASVLGKYIYMVIPVYATSSEGHFELTDSTHYQAEVTITNANQAVILDIVSSYDPFILGYKVYRTKVNTQPYSTYREPVDIWERIFQGSQIEILHAGTESRDFYFLAYFKKPANANSNTRISLLDPLTVVTINGVQYKFTERNINNANTRQVAYTSKKPFNWFSHVTGMYYNLLPPPTALSAGYGMLCTCGTYAQKRLFLSGNAKYPQMLFLSNLDQTDYFLADNMLTLHWAALENMATAIMEIGQNIFVLLKNGGLYALYPTQSADVPYILDPRDNGIGCDSLNSCCVLGRTGYFIFKNKLYDMNEHGQYREIGAGINSILATQTSEIILKPNVKENFIKIMFRTATGCVNIDYYPQLGIWIEHTGYKDIYTVSGSTATLNAKSERYQLVNYNYMPDLNEEWGVDLDGNIIKRASTYNNTGDPKCTWNNYNADSTAVTTVYPVESVLERGLHFSAKILVNAIILYGTSPIKYQVALDDKVYDTAKEVTMTELGYQIPINSMTNLLLFKLIHDIAAEIDLQMIEIIYNHTQRITVKNTIGAGA